MADTYIYEAGQNGDAELLEWYLSLCASGDIKLIFGDRLAPGVGDFLEMFRSQNMSLVYEFDDKGWTCVGWLRPFMGGAMWGLWIRPDLRGQARPVEFCQQLHDAAFQRFPLLLLTTTQAKVVGEMQTQGYTLLGRIPALYGEGCDGDVMFLTRETYEQTQDKWKERINGRSSGKR